MYTIAAIQNDLSVLRSEFPNILQALRAARRAGRSHGATGVVHLYDPEDRLLLTRDFIPF
jgi:hypothetical protein